MWSHYLNRRKNWEKTTSSRDIGTIGSLSSSASCKLAVRILAAMVPRWSSAIERVALLSMFEFVFTSSRDDTYEIGPVRYVALDGPAVGSQKGGWQYPAEGPQPATLGDRGPLRRQR